MTTRARQRRLGAAGRYVRARLLEAGIVLNGDAPWDIQVRNHAVYWRVLLDGTLGLGDSYVDGWWDCRDLGACFERLIAWRNARRTTTIAGWPRLLLDLRRRVLGRQSVRRSREVVDVHYDLPIGLFEAMLGPTMTYSCAYWREAETLDDAQRAKMDLICRKLAISRSDRILELGCGFGSFARFAAERYGCSVVAVTNSGSHARYAREACRGLPVEIHECDYRAADRYLNGRRFDKVVSLAMCEAVGSRHYRMFMEIVDRALTAKGVWLLHTLGDDTCSSDPWMNRHIFPNGELPTRERLETAMRGLFVPMDFHRFESDYWRTVAAWEANFVARWDELRAHDAARFDDRFYRMWTYYLRSCWGSLRVGNMQLWQLVLAKPGAAAPYEAVR